MLLDLDQQDDRRWQTVRHLTTKNPSMPVIGMTARHGRNWLADAADLEDLLQKPFDVTSLLRIVAAFPRKN
jgi:DNA-binding NtrC family response regulator